MRSFAATTRGIGAPLYFATVVRQIRDRKGDKCRHGSAFATHSGGYSRIPHAIRKVGQALQSSEQPLENAQVAAM